MNDPATIFLDATGASVAGRITIPPRPERHLPIPAGYNDPLTTAWLAKATGNPGSLWRHQALALELVDAGKDVVVATGTASGKSLIFQLAAIKLLRGGRAKILATYPQKGLAGDQLVSWQRLLEAAGLDQSLVGEINGDIPMSERARVMSECRVILATPDIMHVWILPQSATPLGRSYFSDLALAILDEAHLYDGAFGSSTAMALRRLICAADRHGSRIQFIAASATVANPAEHLTNLTGRGFAAVTEDDNGAPTNGLTVLHIEGPDHGSPAEKMLTDTIDQLKGAIAPHAMIVFQDSRQGAERTAANVGDDHILPYRSGYEAADRREIERRMRKGELRGVVSTSALEVGINVPQFRYGINLGLPQTLKGLRQRCGRVGRTAPGVFVIIGPSTMFAQLGTTFEAYFMAEPERANLYLSNRFILFQQAWCLIAELPLDDGEITLPTCASWPPAFPEMFQAALPGAVRPRDLDALASLGGDSPHHAYPLRRVGDVTFTIKHARGGDDVIGRIEHDKALREAPPGATYRHNKRAFRVTEWLIRRHEHVILVEPCSGAPTRPMLRTQVNFAFGDGGLIEGRHVAHESGSLSEVAVGVLESVEGITIGSTRVPYREASKKDPRLSRKQREYSSTGVALRLMSSTFKGSGEHQIAARLAVANALTTLLVRYENISPQDVRFSHTGNALLTPAGAQKLDDAIVLFDAAAGGFRLSAPLFTNFGRYLDLLEKGARLAPQDALLSDNLVRELREWHGLLEPAGDGPAAQLPASDELIVFAPESEVALRHRGTLVHRRLLGPELVTIDDEERLMYRYESHPGVSAMVAHDMCEPIGQDWRRMFWNPDTNLLREIEA